MAKISLAAQRVVSAVMQGRTIRRNGRPLTKTERMPRWIVPQQRRSRARRLLVEAWSRRNSAFSRAWIRQGGTVLVLLPPLTRKQAKSQRKQISADEEAPDIISRRVTLWRGCLDDPAKIAQLKQRLIQLQAKSWTLFLHDSPPCHPFSPAQRCGPRKPRPSCVACRRLQKCCKPCRGKLVRAKQLQGMKRLRTARALQNLVPWQCATHEQPERARMANGKWPSILPTPSIAIVSMCGLGITWTSPEGETRTLSKKWKFECTSEFLRAVLGAFATCSVAEEHAHWSCCRCRGQLGPPAALTAHYNPLLASVYAHVLLNYDVGQARQS